MNKSHLLLNIGKTLLSTFLAPGDEAELAGDAGGAAGEWRREEAERWGEAGVGGGGGTHRGRALLRRASKIFHPRPIISCSERFSSD